MKLMTKELERRFAQVGSQENVKDPLIIAKFFNPAGAGTWYATEYDPETRTFFAYVSIFGDWNDEWGTFSLVELGAYKGQFGLGISPYSDLVITKTAQVTEFMATGPITYVIEYANTGLASVSNVEIIDTLPTASLTDLEYSSMPPLTTNPSIPSTISWTIPKLPYGQGGVITITAVVTEPLVAGIYTNTVTITAAESERSSTNNTSQATFQVYNTIYLPVVKK